MKFYVLGMLSDMHAKNEIIIQKVSTSWQFIPAKDLLTQPGAGHWSPAQCLEHLNSYGRYYLPAIENSILKNKRSNTTTYFTPGWLGNYFYKLMLTEQGRVKTKFSSPKKHIPPADLDTQKVITEFISQEEKLGKLLTAAREVSLDKVKVPISFAPFIRLQLGDILRFYTAHIERHMMQAERGLPRKAVEELMS